MCLAIPGRITELVDDDHFFDDIDEKLFRQLIYQMLDTIGKMGGEEGLEYLISILPLVGAGIKMQILNLLSNFDNQASHEAIRDCLYDREVDVRLLANSLVKSTEPFSS